MNIFSLTLEQLTEKLGRRSYAEAVFRALYRGNIRVFDEMPLKSEIKDLLKSEFTFELPECVGVSDGESAVKYLFRLSDGSMIESVLMRHEYGSSVCVSTQAGCSMGCAFCRSGRLKKVRNLTAGEMVGQLLAIKEKSAEALSGIAVMGIGEPFDNYENLLDFIDIALYQNGLNFGPRHITISTCGIVPKIDALAKSRYNVNLAISLHAPYNELRSRLMPVNDAYPLETLIPAAKRFSELTNRRVTLEYVMLRDVNDSVECAERLAELIGDSKCYVNIIRYNPGGSDDFECSTREQIMRFYDVLKKNSVGVTMRREMGGKVEAACGQLSAQTGFR